MYNCKLCGTKLEPMIDLGVLPLANDLLDPQKPEEAYWFDGSWDWCPKCQVLQLADAPPDELVYTENYPYISSTSKYMDWHFNKTAKHLDSLYNAPFSILEIAANSGGILPYFNNKRCDVIAVEPMCAAWPYLEKQNIPVLKEKFNRDLANVIFSNFGAQDLVFMANTIRSLVDLDTIFTGVSTVLDGHGIFVFEEPYLPYFMARNEYDQLYSENVWALTITFVANLGNRYGFRLIDIDPLPDNHGGSLRYHVEFGKNGVSDHVQEFASIIGEDNLHDRLKKWQTRIDDNAFRLRNLVESHKRDGKRVVGYAATAKSVTTLSRARLDDGHIDCVYDTTPTKWGKLLPKSRIPIRDASNFGTEVDRNDVVILWAYNHANEIISREGRRNWILTYPDIHTRTF